MWFKLERDPAVTTTWCWIAHLGRLDVYVYPWRILATRCEGH